MALTLTAKPSGADYRYTYTVPVADGDSLLSYTLTETGCTILSDEASGNDIVFLVSGGTAGTTATIEVEALTADGETIPETLYVPIRATANQAGDTVSDVVQFALRPIHGFGADIGSEYMTQALEAFNDLVAEWRIDGLDVGIPGAAELTDVLVVRDEFLSALKFNLRVRVADEYGYQLPAATVQTALRTRMLVENALYTPNDLTFETALQQKTVMTGING